MDEPIKDLRSADAARVKDAADSIVRQQEELRTAIEKAIQESIAASNRAAAVQQIALLGKLRAPTAVPFLIDHLTFKAAAGGIPGPPSPPEDQFPCVAALIEIGLPAVKPLVLAKGTSSDAVDRLCARRVLNQLLGRTAGVAYLDELINGETDKSKQDQLLMFKKDFVASQM